MSKSIFAGGFLTSDTRLIKVLVELIGTTNGTPFIFVLRKISAVGSTTGDEVYTQTFTDTSAWGLKQWVHVYLPENIVFESGATPDINGSSGAGMSIGSSNYLVEVL